jgi:hypothetical protein
MRACFFALAFLSLPTLAAAAPRCQPLQAERTIMGLKLHDPLSGRKVLGTALKEGLPGVEQDKDAAGVDQSFPYIRYANRDGSQELKLFIHYGDIVDSYNEAEIAPVSGRVSTAKRLPLAAFSTEHGIKLGMRERDLVRLLGPCFKRVRKGAAHEIRYAISDENHPLLKDAGMPSYYSYYRFRRGRLVYFQFGFEYP